jgi:hypothetical protein
LEIYSSKLVCEHKPSWQSDVIATEKSGTLPIGAARPEIGYRGEVVDAQ